MVFLHHDTGYIHAVPINSHTSTAYSAAFKTAIDLFWHHGYKPTIHRLDNAVFTFMDDKKRQRTI